MNPSLVSPFPNVDSHPVSPYPKCKFYIGPDGQPWFEHISAKSYGLLEDGDVIRQPVREADIEAHPLLWETFKTSQQATRRGGNK